jgi:hypothetical protein
MSELKLESAWPLNINYSLRLKGSMAQFMTREIRYGKR